MDKASREYERCSRIRFGVLALLVAEGGLFATPIAASFTRGSGVGFWALAVLLCFLVGVGMLVRETTESKLRGLLVGPTLLAGLLPFTGAIRSPVGVALMVIVWFVGILAFVEGLRLISAQLEGSRASGRFRTLQLCVLSLPLGALASFNPFLAVLAAAGWLLSFGYFFAANLNWYRDLGRALAGEDLDADSSPQF